MLEVACQNAAVNTREASVTGAYAIVARSLAIAFVVAPVQWITCLAGMLLAEWPSKIGIAEAFALNTFTLSDVFMASWCWAILFFACVTRKSRVALALRNLVLCDACSSVITL